MDSIVFIKNYLSNVNQIAAVVDPKHQHIIEILKAKNPHDLISSDTWFSTEYAVKGFVWCYFLRELRNKGRVSF